MTSDGSYAVASSASGGTIYYNPLTKQYSDRPVSSGNISSRSRGGRTPTPSPTPKPEEQIEKEVAKPTTTQDVKSQTPKVQRTLNQQLAQQYQNDNVFPEGYTAVGSAVGGGVLVQTPEGNVKPFRPVASSETGGYVYSTYDTGIKKSGYALSGENKPTKTPGQAYASGIIDTFQELINPKNPRSVSQQLKGLAIGAAVVGGVALAEVGTGGLATPFIAGGLALGTFAYGEYRASKATTPEEKAYISGQTTGLLFIQAFTEGAFASAKSFKFTKQELYVGKTIQLESRGAKDVTNIVGRKNPEGTFTGLGKVENKNVFVGITSKANRVVLTEETPVVRYTGKGNLLDDSAFEYGFRQTTSTGSFKTNIGSQTFKVNDEILGRVDVGTTKQRTISQRDVFGNEIKTEYYANSKFNSRQTGSISLGNEEFSVTGGGIARKSRNSIKTQEFSVEGYATKTNLPDIEKNFAQTKIFRNDYNFNTNNRIFSRNILDTEITKISYGKSKTSTGFTNQETINSNLELQNKLSNILSGEQPKPFGGNIKLDTGIKPFNIEPQSLGGLGFKPVSENVKTNQLNINQYLSLGKPGSIFEENNIKLFNSLPSINQNTLAIDTSKKSGIGPVILVGQRQYESQFPIQEPRLTFSTTTITFNTLKIDTPPKIPSIPSFNYPDNPFYNGGGFLLNIPGLGAPTFPSGRTKAPKRTFRRIPSLVAFELNIVESKPRALESTGIGIRPILGKGSKRRRAFSNLF